MSRRARTHAFAAKRRALPAGWVVGALLYFALASGFGASLAAAGETPEAGRAASPTPAPASFEALLESLAQMPGFESGFREEKTIALLAEPLVSAGRLYFQPPDRLLRRTASPRASDVLVSRERVVLVDGESATTIDLASQEQIRPLVESLLWLFAGDREALVRTYTIEYQRGDETHGADAAESAWTLRLLPRNSPLDLLIQELRIAGAGLEARRFEVVEASGDRSVTTLIEPDPGRVFAAEERRALFEAPAP